MTTGTGMERQTQTHTETAGENLQDDAVLTIRTGWRDAGLEGPHPKTNPGRVPLAAVPPGVHGTIPRSGVEPVPYGGCCADP